MANDAILILRTWIKGQGCVFLRGPDLTDNQAAAVMGEVQAQESEGGRRFANGEIRRLDLTHSPGVVWILPSEGKDPDEPGRPVLLLRVLYSPKRNRPTKEAAERTLETVNFPAASSDRSWVPFTPRDPETIAAERPSKLSRRGVAGAVAFAAAAAFYGLRGLGDRGGDQTGSSNGETSWFKNPKGEAANESDVGSPRLPTKEESKWKMTKIDLGDLLESDWAKKIRGEDQGAPDDDDALLVAFAELFKRPDVGEFGIEEREERAQLDQRLKDENEADATPFSAFLFQLPENPVEILEGLSSDLGPQRRFEGLVAKLKDRGLPLEPKDIENSAKTALSYEFFFDERWKRNPKNKKKEINDPRWSKMGEEKCYKWIPDVCKIFEERYGLTKDKSKPKDEPETTSD